MSNAGLPPSGEYLSEPPKGASPNKRSALWVRAGIALALVVVVTAAVVVGAALRLLKPQHGETGNQNAGAGQQFHDLIQIVGDPRAGFPNKDRINILVMGIDDNWTNSNVVYTTGARTDTLFLLSLDLANKKGAILSIPRDSYVPIAGTGRTDKINAAFATGGPLRSCATVQQLTGVFPDYYVVLNIDATKKMVDALGGVDVDVEHQMDYDDNWGHLHVHLKPGFQHLDGDDAVAFARYRHGNHGVSAEDGDDRRIYRQHILTRAMIDRAKTFTGVMHANDLVNTAMDCVRTNLTRTQIFDLASIFNKVPQQNIQTAQLTGTDARSPFGAYITMLDPAQIHAYVAWLIRGNESAAWAVTPVVVKNATKVDGLGQHAVEQLQASGFRLTTSVTSVPADSGKSEILDTGVEDQQAARGIESLLDLKSAVYRRQPVQPNHLGWTPPPSITLTLGQDYAAQSSHMNSH